MIESLAAIILILVIIIVCLVYTSRASTEISSIKSPDDKLTQAKKYLLGISIAGWIIVIGLVIGLIVLFVYGEEIIYSPTGYYVFNGILVLVVILTLVIGIVAALAATQIGNSSLYPSSDTGSIPVLKAYEFSVVAGVTGILVFIQTVLLLTYSINGYSPSYVPEEYSPSYVPGEYSPGGYGQPVPQYPAPGGYRQAPGEYRQPAPRPGGYRQAPGGYRQAPRPGGYRQAPGGYRQAPGGYRQAQGGYRPNPAATRAEAGALESRIVSASSIEEGAALL